ncbi:hypothetical protein TNCV_944241 [Trichonephila clavipes]|nr:hypothetical protein TNCV_944241 [Trichonephila clavipes]
MTSIEQWYSRRSRTSETHTVKRALHSPFADCTNGTVIQLDGNLSLCLASLATYNTPELSLTRTVKANCPLQFARSQVLCPPSMHVAAVASGMGIGSWLALSRVRAQYH